jgi:hypothetical protein
MKAPWNFYGQVVSMSGQVSIIQEYPPKHQTSKLLGGQSASQIVLVTDDGIILDLFMPNTSGDIQVGHYITLYAYPVGLIEVDNRFGGKTTQLMLVGNQVINHY